MDWETMMKEAESFKDEMTDAERNRAYAKGEEVDHIPYSFSSAETLPPMYGFTMGEFRRSKEVQLELARRLYQDYGIYKVGVGLGLKRLGAALGSVLEYPENRVVQKRKKKLLQLKVQKAVLLMQVSLHLAILYRTLLMREFLLHVQTTTLKVLTH